MSGLEIGSLNEAKKEQQELSLTVMDAVQIASRFSVALEQQVSSLQADSIAALANDQDAAARLVASAVDQVILEMLDPSRQVTAGGLDEAQAAALNDVTKTRAEEAADYLGRCAQFIDEFRSQLTFRQHEIAELGDGAAGVIRSLVSDTSLEEQLRAAEQSMAAMTINLQSSESTSQSIVAAAQQGALERIGYSDANSIQDLIDQSSQVREALVQLKADQDMSFTWERSEAITRLEAVQGQVAVDTLLALELTQREVLASTVDKALDEDSDYSVGRITTYTPSRDPGVRPDIDGPLVQGAETAQRISAEDAKRALDVLGQLMSDQTCVAAAWDRARQDVLDRVGGATTLGEAVGDLTESEARELVIGRGGLYDQTRARFWEEVYQDPIAKEYFLNNGFVFDEGAIEAGKGVRAPVHQSLPQEFEDYPASLKDEFRVSLDHIAPKAQDENWKIALDSDNLRYVVQAENRYLHLLDRLGVLDWPPR